MKTLVVYDSLFDNTRHIAVAIAEVFRRYGATQLASASDVGVSDLKAYNVLLFGCPTQRHKASPAMQALLEHLPRNILRGQSVAAFDTRYKMSEFLSGSAAHIIARKLNRTGATLLMPAESFFVSGREGPLEPGELDRAMLWAEQLVTHCPLKSLSGEQA